jgi:hypothetical protein
MAGHLLPAFVSRYRHPQRRVATITATRTWTVMKVITSLVGIAIILVWDALR